VEYTCDDDEVCVEGDCRERCDEEGALRCDPRDFEEIETCRDGRWEDLEYCMGGRCHAEAGGPVCGSCLEGDTRCIGDGLLQACDAQGDWVDVKDCRRSRLTCGCYDRYACDCLPCDHDEFGDEFGSGVTCGGNEAWLCLDGYWVTYDDCAAAGDVCALGACTTGEGITGVWLFLGSFQAAPGEAACVFPPAGMPLDLLRSIEQRGDSFDIGYPSVDGGDDPFVLADGVVSGSEYTGGFEVTMPLEGLDCTITLAADFAATLEGEQLVGSWLISFDDLSGVDCPAENPGGNLPWPPGCVVDWVFVAERR